MRMFKLKRDERGAAAIEMAISQPVLVFYIYGIFESALLLWASAGMQHAIGEGARLATIYPTPNATAVSNQVAATLFGTYDAKSGYPAVSVVPSSSGSSAAKPLPPSARTVPPHCRTEKIGACGHLGT